MTGLGLMDLASPTLETMHHTSNIAANTKIIHCTLSMRIHNSHEGATGTTAGWSMTDSTTLVSGGLVTLLFIFLFIAPKALGYVPTNNGKKLLPRSNRWWYPKEAPIPEDLFVSEDASISSRRRKLEEESVWLAARLVEKRLEQVAASGASSSSATIATEPYDDEDVHALARDRFRDLTCTRAGERILESLFLRTAVHDVNDAQVHGAVVVFQSLCVMGSLMGLQGRSEQIQKRFAHLDSNDSISSLENEEDWTDDDIRKLKRNKDRGPGTALLAALLRKRTPRGAYQLLVDMGIWSEIENLHLIRSGARVRFRRTEEMAARELVEKTNVPCDVDEILGIRQDLTHMKVYTIDDAKAAEIDDGVSLEELSDGRKKVWIHIADADRWAPKGSILFEAARCRITSIYLPEGDVPMFPADLGTHVMSLRANQDSCALSLSVELNEDGSIIESTITMVPSKIRVSYRLTYQDVDEMFEEGSAYNEEKGLGILYEIAKRRFDHRKRNDSIESRIPNQIPTASISVSPDCNAPQNFRVAIELEEGQKSDFSSRSPAQMVVTEAMILAGEALGKYAALVCQNATTSAAGDHSVANGLRVPYRVQRIDTKGREQEVKTADSLLEYNSGNGYCHAWYYRRFLGPVSISENQGPHDGLGIDCYVQWSSPIRRFSDLQVHTAVKRLLRRDRAYELIDKGHTLPGGIEWHDLGVPHGAVKDGRLMCDIAEADLDMDIHYQDGRGIIQVVRGVQRQSNNRWMYEYLHRLKEGGAANLKAIVLGYGDPKKDHVAVLVEDLGLEHRMVGHGLNVGDELSVMIGKVTPEAGILQLYQV